MEDYTKIEFQNGFDRSKLVIGCDETNYSPSLAGDCVVVACWLPLDNPIEGINDSKQLTHKQHLELFAQITEAGLYRVELATPNDITVLGIYHARNLAAELAIEGLNRKLITRLGRPADLILTETSMKILKDTLPMVEPMKHGDQISYLIGAASIIAKVYTDALFEGYNNFWPGYNLASNHGSVENKHKLGLKELGPSPVHRLHNYAGGWWAKLLDSK